MMACVEAAPELVLLGVDGRGRDRFSTREMVAAAEQRMEMAAAVLAVADGHGWVGCSLGRSSTQRWRI